MRVIRVLVIILLNSVLSRAQDVSTVFIDTLKIVVDGRVLYESYQTNLKFVLKDQNTALSLFDDGEYKFVYNTNTVVSEKEVQEHSLFKKDSIIVLKPNQVTYNFEERLCSGIIGNRYVLKSLDEKSEPNEKYVIDFRYRTCDFAPKDTTHYKYNYRQGEWIGTSSDSKEIIINYENDKKNGEARVIYSNGTVYKTYFINGNIDNNGFGSFENYKLSAGYGIPTMISLSCGRTNDKFDFKFNLVKANKYKKIDRADFLSVTFVKKGLRKDSIEYNLHGNFLTIRKDTMVIKSDELAIHNFYKKKTDSLHFCYKNIHSGFQKVPLKDISLIKKSRKNLQDVVVSLTLLSFVSAVIISPIISIEKQGFNTERFLKISGTSLGVAVISVTAGIVFGSEKYWIKSKSGKKNVWTIVPEN